MLPPCRSHISECSHISPYPSYPSMLPYLSMLRRVGILKDSLDLLDALGCSQGRSLGLARPPFRACTLCCQITPFHASATWRSCCWHVWGESPRRCTDRPRAPGWFLLSPPCTANARALTRLRYHLGNLVEVKARQLHRVVDAAFAKGPSGSSQASREILRALIGRVRRRRLLT
jgi:hypothetical protein